MTSAPRPFSPFDTLLPYQRAWVADAARFKLALWSRQIGKSYATGFEAVTDCGANPGAEWLVMSAGQRQSDEWMLKAAKIVRAFCAVTEGTPCALRATITASEIKFSNGSRILSLPANSRAMVVSFLPSPAGRDDRRGEGHPHYAAVTAMSGRSLSALTRDKTPFRRQHVPGRLRRQEARAVREGSVGEPVWACHQG
jgi:hypothetical protein